MTSATDHDALAEYVVNARWFGGKGRSAALRSVQRVATLGSLDDDGALLGIELVTFGYDDGDVEIYQVPLAYYRDRQDRLEHAFVGWWDEPEVGKVHAYDAAHDHVAADLLLQGFADGRVEGELVFHRVPGHELDLDVKSTMLSGEQSNSSLAFGDDSLLKLFRKVNIGRNPDIEIHEALTVAGVENVAALYGWMELAERGDEPVQLAMLQQFLRTAADGWELALASVRDLFAEADLRADEVGGDFAAESERLGAATASVHEALASEFPVERWGAAETATVARDMSARLDAAVGVVPELATYAERLRATYRTLEEIAEPVEAQRVHGDLHLGQTLRTVKGWKIVDFEGEPAKPLAERVRPDSRWRDVAGMLRSFDYAAHAVEQDVDTTDDGRAQIAYRAAEWAQRNQDAFLRGYLDEADPTSTELALLTAYAADKAVYEAVYEARNRPLWLPIPLGAIDRLTRAVVEPG